MVDLSLRLLRSGYHALPDDRRQQGDTDPFVTRLLGRRTVVVRGRAGAELFYDESVVRRRGGVPAPLKNLLFGRGAVHGLDDAEHLRRKAVFLEILAPGRTEALAADIGRRLREGVSLGEVPVFPTLAHVYGAAVLPWAGVDAGPAETERRARDLAAIVDGFGNDARANVRARWARRRVERWAREEVRRVRAGHPVREGSALAVLSSGTGAGLDVRTAAVELVNVLRPTVAVAWPATFAALALAQHPEWRSRLRGPGAATGRRAFAHEVRRLTPFAPALAGRVRRIAQLDGVELRRGDRIVLDVPGTDTDGRLWVDPLELRPERHESHDPAPYDLVAQGGGGVERGHRCPGEPLTVAIMAETLGWLAEHELELVSAATVDESRIPTLPAEGVRLFLD